MHNEYWTKRKLACWQWLEDGKAANQTNIWTEHPTNQHPTLTDVHKTVHEIQDFARKTTEIEDKEALVSEIQDNLSDMLSKICAHLVSKFESGFDVQTEARLVLLVGKFFW